MAGAVLCPVGGRRAVGRVRGRGGAHGGGRAEGAPRARGQRGSAGRGHGELGGAPGRGAPPQVPRAEEAARAAAAGGAVHGAQARGGGAPGPAGALDHGRGRAGGGKGLLQPLRELDDGPRDGAPRARRAGRRVAACPPPPPVPRGRPGGVLPAGVRVEPHAARAYVAGGSELPGMVPRARGDGAGAANLAATRAHGLAPRLQGPARVRAARHARRRGVGVPRHGDGRLAAAPRCLRHQMAAARARRPAPHLDGAAARGRRGAGAGDARAGRGGRGRGPRPAGAPPREPRGGAAQRGRAGVHPAVPPPAEGAGARRGAQGAALALRGAGDRGRGRHRGGGACAGQRGRAGRRHEPPLRAHGAAALLGDHPLPGGAAAGGHAPGVLGGRDAGAHQPPAGDEHLAPGRVPQLRGRQDAHGGGAAAGRAASARAQPLARVCRGGRDGRLRAVDGQSALLLVLV
mmetsp:Transcript_65046/g.205519  ORF Transcript_65046/g.205519 Transcript_65046/m.205519 type:complete len:460 (+) Transcript_65046:1142-2521(+)